MANGSSYTHSTTLCVPEDTLLPIAIIARKYGPNVCVERSAGYQHDKTSHVLPTTTVSGEVLFGSRLPRAGFDEPRA
jgi:hypothetical protein